MFEEALPDTLPHWLAARARLQPDAAALEVSGDRLTWRALEQRSLELAGGLHALGVRAGDHVGVLAGNSLAWVATWHAAAYLGAVIVSLNTRWKDDELNWAIDHADVSVLVFDHRVLSAGLLERVSRLRTEWLKVRHYLQASGDVPSWAKAFDSVRGVPPACAATAQSVTLIQFTSGSTARPKGVMLTQAGMLANARGSAQAIGMRSSDRYFSPRPFFHVAGSTGGILRTLVTGACLVTTPAFDEAEAVGILRDQPCDLVAGNEAMLLKLIESLGDTGITRLRGGQAAAGPEVQRQLHDRLGIRGMCCSYGLSEASPGVAFARWNDPLDERIAGKMWPLPGVELRIRDPESGADLRPGQSGEILVRGPSVMVGYYKMPEASAAALSPEGWLATGDLGVLDASGQLRFIGRLKDIIRVGGENLAPAEVEDLLLRHPAVAASQVVGVPDIRLGELPVAFVALKPGQSCQPHELIAWVRERIAGFKVPRRVVLVPGFDDVMTGSGKPRKDLLRARAIAAMDSSSGT